MAAGELSTLSSTAMTASAMASLDALPSHSISSSPCSRQMMRTASFITLRIVSGRGFSVKVSSSVPSSSLAVAPFVVLSLGFESCDSVTSTLPNVPSSDHLIRSMPAAPSVMRCRHVMAVVFRPAYSLRSSGAMSESLNSFCTSTPLMTCPSSFLLLTSVPFSSSSSPLAGGLSNPAIACGLTSFASRPTTFAIFSLRNGILTSSQFAGEYTLNLPSPSSLDRILIMLPLSPCTSTTTGASTSSMNARFSAPSTCAAKLNSCTVHRRGIITLSSPPGPVAFLPIIGPPPPRCVITAGIESGSFMISFAMVPSTLYPVITTPFLLSGAHRSSSVRDTPFCSMPGDASMTQPPTSSNRSNDFSERMNWKSHGPPPPPLSPPPSALLSRLCSFDRMLSFMLSIYVWYTTMHLRASADAK